MASKFKALKSIWDNYAQLLEFLTHILTRQDFSKDAKTKCRAMISLLTDKNFVMTVALELDVHYSLKGKQKGDVHLHLVVVCSISSASILKPILKPNGNKSNSGEVEVCVHTLRVIFEAALY